MNFAFGTSIRVSAAALLGLGAIAYASSASACDVTSARQPASYLTTSSSGLQQVAYGSNPNSERTSIVGMWQFSFTPSDPAGAPGDFGYVQWHSDGTELMNSGARAPATENFCMGVWQQTGPRSYHLNHFALSYDLTTGAQNAKVNIKEDVTLDSSGTSYSGSYTLDVFPPGGGSAVYHEAGNVTATRVNAD